jgi:hypothetical protein
MRACTHLLIAAAALAFAGCGALLGPPVDTTLTLWNRAQSEVLEARVHDCPAYAGAPNLLSAPLAVEAQAGVPFHTGQCVTVLRRRVELGDPTAFTTAEGLDDVRSAGWVLIIFDASFRLMEPGTAD